MDRSEMTTTNSPIIHINQEYPFQTTFNIKHFILDICHKKNITQGQLEFSFIDEKKMTDLNKKHLQHDNPTDTLSFNLGSTQIPDGATGHITGSSEQPLGEADVPAVTRIFPGTDSAAGTDVPSGPAAVDDSTTIPPFNDSFEATAQQVGTIKQVTPTSRVINSGGSTGSGSGKRCATRDSTSHPEARARAKAKPKAVPKPKGGRRNLNRVHSTPESRVATFDSIQNARNYPHLPPEPRPPDD